MRRFIGEQGALTESAASPSLPAEVNSFVGRKGLLREAVHLLDTARLITLVGTGGVGKTRLLERLAADMAVTERFKDRIVFVRLADLKEADDRLESTIADAIGILDNSSSSGTARLIEYFRHRHVLLMLDNCEHLVGQTPGSGQLPRLLNILLQAAPDLRVVTTSRVRLSVRGEHLLLVPPLCAGDTVHCEEFEDAPGEHEAVRLFIDRAAAIGVDIPDRDRPLATRFCRMLSGLPLAIELAAAQLDIMTLREMVDHPDLLQLLVDGSSPQPHHRTMHAAIHWSFKLLTAQEQRMWALTAVFEGGFDLEAARAVCHLHDIEQDQVLGLLARLVRKSVLLAEARNGRTRYRMLEMIRHYGLELVAEADVETQLRFAHAEYFEALTEQSAREWFGPGEVSWMRRLRADMSNLRAAQEYFLSRAGFEGRALRLSINATRAKFFYFAGVLNESRRMLGLGLDGHSATPSHDRIAALSLASWVARCQGDLENAVRLMAEADTVARELNCHDSFGPLLCSRGANLWMSEADSATARKGLTMLARAEREFHAQGASGDAYMALLLLAIGLAFHGDRNSAVAETQRLLARARAAGARWSISWALWAGSLVELQFGSPERARGLAQEGLRIQREIGDTWGPSWAVWLLANIAVKLRQYDLGGQLFGGARVGRRLTQASVLGLLPLLRRQQQAEMEARRELGDDEFEIHVAMGGSKSWNEVVDLAFQVQPRPQSEGGMELPCGLSEREFEVAGLVTTGLTNREIGQRLNISFRTVEVHVQNINRKLGVSNRVEITSWYLTLPKALTESPAAVPHREQGSSAVRDRKRRHQGA